MMTARASPRRLLPASATEVMGDLWRPFLVTDSVAAATGEEIPVELVRLDGLLAEAIRLLHDGGSLEALLARGEAAGPPR